jgi:Rps23 Pro-64 3,4-dihydroxylase Tpa1-like proline 4-hydroxylase
LFSQAQAYFPQKLYEQLVDELLAYGESQLGCRAITPIWMSYYINGCCQELHCDSYHGPYAFVLSLTHWDTRKFTGGETMILKPQVLNFWQGFDPSKGLEMRELVTLVEPRFNQLTLFDPRFPHGVRPVAGTQDPREARLVLHGECWGDAGAGREGRRGKTNRKCLPPPGRQVCL